MTVKAAMPERFFNLVVPLEDDSTAMRTTDTAGDRRAWSGAVSRTGHRPGDVDSTTGRSTPTTPATPGTRTSGTATRTTTTRTTSCAPGPSADRSATPAEFSFADLVAAYFDCRRTKRNTPSALAFEADLERNLAGLYDDLVDGTYRPGRTICFVITRPKPREVWAAGFRDRVVHHALYNRIAPRFERAFIADICACIKGRGTLYGARRLEAKVRSITQNWSRPAWYLKLDIESFFVSIDKRILGHLLECRIREPWWRELAATVLWHDPRDGVDLRGDRAQLARIPPAKSLFSQPAHLGLPIGNLSSQFFANVYLDVLDQHVKHRLRARHYVRYVDDLVLLHASPQWLNAARAEISEVLAVALRLKLNAGKTILQPLDRGVDFVGQVIAPWHRRIRRRTFNEALTRIAGAEADELHQSANSYLGLLRQVTHSHADRARIANLVRRRGLAVDHHLTKAYR